jgi:hypothetical protein
MDSEKIEKVLAAYRQHLKKLGIQIKKTERRLLGASEGVLVRRFTFDLKALQEQYEEMKGKKEWAERKLASILYAKRVKNACDNEGNLKHNPFNALKGISV